MGETTVQERMAALRTDDGLIEGAVAELDTKLAAWLAAMREGQTALTGGVGRSSAATNEDARLERAIAGSPEQHQGTAVRHGSKLFEGQVPAVTVAGRDRPISETPTLPSRDEVSCSEDEDDEALLASLDAQTASAIRVKRRLADNRRSVRELLEEIRSERPPGEATDSQRTGWWRRSNERDDG